MIIDHKTKVFNTSNTTLAAALVTNGCRLSFPPCEIIRSGPKSHCIFRLEAVDVNHDPFAMATESINGDLEVNHTRYERHRKQLMDLMYASINAAD